MKQTARAPSLVARVHQEFRARAWRRRPAAHWLAVLRTCAIAVFVGMLAVALYGTVVPAAPRCALPAAVGCPGGVFGPAVAPLASNTQWFDVTMYDWGFWIIDSTTGANVSGTWTIFEDYTININATSLAPNTAIGGTAYHGLGVEVNATGQQLLSLSAPVGKWVSASFVAPASAYYHQHIWCTIECGPGHSSQQEHNLNIVPAVPLPKASVSANVTAGPAPLSVSFSGAGASGTPPYNLSWSFGDGSTAVFGPTVSHTYLLGGIYYATLTVLDAKGNQAQSAVTVTVLSGAGLNATLTATPTQGVAPLGTTFSVEAHGGTPPYAYAWAYGDGSGGPGGNLTDHLFTAPGVYATVVTVTDSAGARATGVASVVVDAPSGSLTLVLNASPANGTTPLQATLGATVTGGNAPYAVSWALGDGSTATGLSVGHLYNQTGYYEAVAFASDAAGHSATAALAVPITAPTSGGGSGGDGGGNGSDDRPAAAGPAAATPLTVRVLVDPSGGAAPLSVLAVASIENGTGTNESVSWTFGDGTTATGLVVSHVYGSAGNYSVAATASDSGGNSGTGSGQVVVGRPSVAIVLNQSAGDTPVSILGGVTLTGGTGAWSPAVWHWGDGLTATGFLVAHSYAANLSGNLTVQASATDAAGHTVTATAIVGLTGPPTATLAVTLPTGHALPANVSFQLTVRGGTGGYPSQVLWNFGDLSSTRGPVTENHSYGRTGHFQVVVETNDSAGRYAIATAWVNLSSAVVGLPPLAGGGSGWILTGVSDPTTASFILMGLVAVTGLGFLVRRHRRPARGGRPGDGREAPATSPGPPARAPPLHRSGPP